MDHWTRCSPTSAFILSRLDYCNTILASLPSALLCHCNMRNAVARLIACLAQHDHVKSTIWKLTWLPVCNITSDIQNLFTRASNRLPVTILSYKHNDNVIQTVTVNGRSRLQSSSSLRHEQPQMWVKYNNATFHMLHAEVAWNSLPPLLQQLSRKHCILQTAS